MNEKKLVKILSELGHQTRLSIFRFVIQYGDAGVTVGELGKQLNISPSTLNFHLHRLVDAKIISQKRQGRQIFCRAKTKKFISAIDWLMSNCCSKSSCNF